MNKLIIDKKRVARIEEIYDWSNGDQECYSVKFKDVDGTIWTDSINKIYFLLSKSTQELNEICNNQ